MIEVSTLPSSRGDAHLPMTMGLNVAAPDGYGGSFVMVMIILWRGRDGLIVDGPFLKKLGRRF
jgi:hypothetical protein